MSDRIDDIVRGIDAITSVDEEDSLRQLQRLVDSFFLHPNAAEHLDVCFRLFERFPEKDAFGIFSTILHGVEHFAWSNSLVVASVLRKPAGFPVLMVNRMLNGGVDAVGGVNLMHLLESVALSTTVPTSVRADAADFLEYQRAKS